MHFPPHISPPPSQARIEEERRVAAAAKEAARERQARLIGQVGQGG